ncbi:hypothetical protein ANO11243_053060 [Dothideomycetidae sp. 11243]|nr:hypothetical protein ANO11243_053060 [fungal sp. No.11243]
MRPPAATATATALSLTRPYLPRAVAIKCTPPLHDIHQSSAVLAALKKRFGAVEHWRNLRYDLANPRPGVALAVFGSADAAARVVQCSPFKCAIEVGGGVHGEGVLRCDIEGSSSEAEPDGDVVQHRRREVQARQDFPALLKAEESERGASAEEWGQHTPSTTKSQGAILSLLENLSGTDAAEGSSLLETEPRYSRRRDEAGKRSFSTSAVRSGTWPPVVAQPEPRVLHFTLHAEATRQDMLAGVRKHPCHGPFEVHARTAVARDVLARAPLRGLADLTLRRERKGWKEVGLARRRNVPPRLDLFKLWEKGRRKREEEEEEARGEDEK